MFGAVTHGWPRTRIENYIEILKVDDPQSALPNVISRTFELIDTKASGLLTHTSMMIAALGVGSRPAFTRTCSRKASWIVCQVPLRRQIR